MGKVFLNYRCKRCILYIYSSLLLSAIEQSVLVITKSLNHFFTDLSDIVGLSHRLSNTTSFTRGKVNRCVYEHKARSSQVHV